MTGTPRRPRSVRRVTTIATTAPGGGFDQAASLDAAALGGDLGPFVDLTWFEMSRPVFRPHPHAGFSAVTYMLESSAGTFRNRWTAGPDQLIGPGSLHWTRAGSGMMHEEVPTVPGVSCRGIQMFVKLPAEKELDSPKAYHLDADQMAEVRNPSGARVRVLAGEYEGTSSRLGLPDDLLYLDVHLGAGVGFDTPAPSDWSAFVFLLSGALDLGAGGRVEGPAGAAFHPDGDQVEVRAVTDANLLYCAGPPIGPFVARGPFIMSTRQRLVDAERRFAAGEMGRLEPSF